MKKRQNNTLGATARRKECMFLLKLALAEIPESKSSKIHPKQFQLVMS